MFIPQNQGQRMTVCIAVDCFSSVYYQIQSTAFNSTDFEIFLSNMADQIPQIYQNNIFIYINNAPPHKEDILTDYIIFTGFDGDFWPAYSLMLTPIRKAIGTIKYNVKTDLNTADMNELLQLVNISYGR